MPKSKKPCHKNVVAVRGGICAWYHSHMRANIKTTTRVPVAISQDLCDVPCFREGLVKKLRSKMPPAEVIEETSVFFGALADRARLKILFTLKQAGELCVCDVAHVLGSTVSTASHHLRKLRDLKLLKYRNDGKMSYYALRNEFAIRLVVEALGKVER